MVPATLVLPALCGVVHDRGWAGALMEEAQAARVERASLEVEKAAEDAAPLSREPLPSCSVFFFHHLEKTGGSTVRSVMQRQAQLGHFEFWSFVNRYGKVQLQMVLHRLDSLVREGRLDGVRLA
eukprot:737188-Prymnesium_polylepis.1